MTPICCYSDIFRVVLATQNDVGSATPQWFSVNVTSRLEPAADGELLLHNIPLLIAMLNLRLELYFSKRRKTELRPSVQLEGNRFHGKADCVVLHISRAEQSHGLCYGEIRTVI